MPLVISAQTPAPNAVGVLQLTMTVTFSRPVDAATVTTSTVELSDSASSLVRASVTHDASTRTATLSPPNALVDSTHCVRWGENSVDARGVLLLSGEMLHGIASGSLASDQNIGAGKSRRSIIIFSPAAIENLVARSRTTVRSSDPSTRLSTPLSATT